MGILDLLQNLKLPFMLAAVLAITATVASLVLIAVRLVVRGSGFDPATPLPIRDTMIGATSAMFALTMAFCAAGIWNDTVQARAAVEREAQALENVLALSQGLPEALRKDVRDGVLQYIQRVVEVEWPAMAHPDSANHSKLYSRSDTALVRLIDGLAAESIKGNSAPAATAVLSQLFQVRSARLSRLTLADGGATAAQWTALILLALSAFVTVAVVHNHHLPIQILSTYVYAVAAAAAFFVILAHDRPFVGIISVSPTPLQQLLARSSADLAPAFAETGRR